MSFTFPWRGWGSCATTASRSSRRDLDTHQTMFAMGEAIAHLNRLEHAGRLVRRHDGDGVIRFTQAQGTPLTPH